MQILEQIREFSAHVQRKGSENEHLSRMVAWYSGKLTCGYKESENESEAECRVAHSAPIIYTYLSLCRNCKNCNYDCRVNTIGLAAQESKQIRGPCEPVNLYEIAKEMLEYE